MKALLIMASLALAGVLVLQWYDWPPEIEHPADNGEPAGTDSTTTDTATSPLELLDPVPLVKEDFANVIERPLFLPDRRPPSEDPTNLDVPQIVEDVPGVGLETMDLNAVIITPVEAVAWVRTPTKPTPEKLRIGDEVEGWTIKSIQADEVQLERQGKTDTLVLRDYSRSPPPAARPPRHAAPNPVRRRAPPVQRQGRRPPANIRTGTNNAQPPRQPPGQPR